MVTKGYEEISAAYWNLIYKDATQPGKVPSSTQNTRNAEELNIATFDNDVLGYPKIPSGAGSKNYIAFDFGIPVAQ